MVLPWADRVSSRTGCHWQCSGRSEDSEAQGRSASPIYINQRPCEEGELSPEKAPPQSGTLPESESASTPLESRSESNTLHFQWQLLLGRVPRGLTS
jgi:hypothetical protein